MLFEIYYKGEMCVCCPAFKNNIKENILFVKKFCFL